MVQFEERSEIEKGFAPIFAERIAPELDRLDNERLSARAKNSIHVSLPMKKMRSRLFSYSGSSSTR